VKYSDDVIKALTVTLEVTSTDMSKAAAMVMLSDLSGFPELQVLGALKRCRYEVKGRLSLADIISRIDDGRPGPEEAWSMIPKDEAASAFWTTEMREAYGVAHALIASGDNVQARMAFLERYRNLMQLARDGRLPVQWEFSPGTDKAGRELVLLDAKDKGRISAQAVMGLLPYHREDEGLMGRLLAQPGMPLLAAPPLEDNRPAGWAKLGEKLGAKPRRKAA
jgi:hypothetical protein